jgi:hypothetical protein
VGSSKKTPYHAVAGDRKKEKRKRKKGEKTGVSVSSSK